MTTAAKASRPKPGAWDDPFTADAIKRVCTDPEFAELVAGARTFINLLPAAIPGRNLAETLRQFSDRMKRAAAALDDLPHEARALISETAGGVLGTDDLSDAVRLLITGEHAKQARIVATIAQAAATRVKRTSVRSTDWRRVEAVTRARQLCERYDLPAARAFDVWVLIVSGIFKNKQTPNIDAFRVAASYLKKDPDGT